MLDPLVSFQVPTAALSFSKSVCSLGVGLLPADLLRSDSASVSAILVQFFASVREMIVKVLETLERVKGIEPSS